MITEGTVATVKLWLELKDRAVTVEWSLIVFFRGSTNGEYQFSLDLTIGDSATLYRTIWARSINEAMEQAGSIVETITGAYLEQSNVRPIQFC